MIDRQKAAGPVDLMGSPIIGQSGIPRGEQDRYHAYEAMLAMAVVIYTALLHCDKGVRIS